MTGDKHPLADADADFYPKDDIHSDADGKAKADADAFQRIVWRGFPSLELWPWVEGGVPSDVPTQQPTV